jgi:hypothetical protein
MSQDKADEFFGEAKASSDWLNEHVATTVGAGTVDAAEAGRLAASWQTPLRKASVPLLPEPRLDEQPISTISEAPWQDAAAETAAPSTNGSARAAVRAKARDQGQRGNLRIILTWAFILIVLLLMFLASPIALNVAPLQPVHDGLLRLLPHAR